MTTDLSWLGPRYAGRRFLRYAELRDLGIVNNRQTLTNWICAGRFPAGIRLGGPGMRALLWPVDEVDAVLEQRATERNPKNSAAIAADAMTAAKENLEQCALTTIQPPGTTTLLR